MLNPTIHPDQYMALRQIVHDLINTYQSVNDRTTVATVQALAVEKIRTAVPIEDPAMEDLIAFILNPRLTKAKAESYFEDFKAFVIPFEKPSAKQIEKAFRKVKKLKQPDLDQLDLREHTYIGWNDPGSQKKYLLFYANGRLTGLSGNIPSEVKKNICTLCHHEDNVALFMATTKTGSEGTYTKRGNYICIDSDKCNRQLTNRQNLDQFAEHLRLTK
ncbi:FusB/FusC family EF-G-binding protein [Enterococcus asini]|uniref:FusB/FusC family EF-G-binding protein n=1 Tax=Enterococcus asini TaxID=57732 RepID=UPI00288FB0E7|nr:FusB/FusC family EF-G-binding protein [Enterococcus asini]MDT2757234.1 FusB/FusC family EF-G-binding protein [Enterococcus asini]